MATALGTIGNQTEVDNSKIVEFIAKSRLAGGFDRFKNQDCDGHEQKLQYFTQFYKIPPVIRNAIPISQWTHSGPMLNVDRQTRI